METNFITYIDTTIDDDTGTGMVVEYNKDTKQFRVSCFENYHWKEQVVFSKDIEENQEFFI